MLFSDGGRYLLAKHALNRTRPGHHRASAASQKASQSLHIRVLIAVAARNNGCAGRDKGLRCYLSDQTPRTRQSRRQELTRRFDIRLSLVLRLAKLASYLFDLALNVMRSRQFIGS